ncbi:hypothetical protein [Parvibaculum sp.]|uniref:hypothetical protein n=1 Tax=Parvibaculum sp. TaxID=2024848 RepID=UPI003C70C86F
MKTMMNARQHRRAMLAGSCAAAVLAIGFSTAVLGAAGLNNRPFSFGSFAGPSIGVAGAQAQLNSQLFGVRPTDILRGPNGTLYSVIQGPGHSALVFDAAGRLVVGFPGATSFGAYRVTPWNYPTLYGEEGGGEAALITGATLTSWTTMVGGGVAIPGTYIYPTTESAINMWIAQVYGLTGK